MVNVENRRAGTITDWMIGLLFADAFSHLVKRMADQNTLLI